MSDSSSRTSETLSRSVIVVFIGINSGTFGQKNPMPSRRLKLRDVQLYPHRRTSNCPRLNFKSMIDEGRQLLWCSFACPEGNK